jgi:hypothetical protein
MWHSRLLMMAVAGLLAACTAYSPPVVVRDSSPFPGIVGVIGQNASHPVDVLLVHGMCTHTASWASGAIGTIAGVIDSHYGGKPSALAGAPNRIEVIDQTEKIGGGTVRFHALVWSPLTADLKQQLAYDNTGSPTDCSRDAECKPKRALFNGKLKDRLLNDCLSDAMIYEGDSHPVMQQALVETLAYVLEQSEASGASGPLVVVAESLGSKMLFDALTAMLEPSAPPRLHALGQHAANRLALVFMAANQLPILGLAEQKIAMPVGAARVAQMDALQRFLALRRSQVTPRGQAFSKLAVVAFTDPNDLLSYRLLPSRYAGPDVAVADVLVSNAPTWFGLLEDPFAAHLDYLRNKDVGSLIACGWPRSDKCR